MEAETATKKTDITARVVGAVAALAAGYVARKSIEFAWEKITGKTPPDEPDSPDVAIGEAIAWAALIGIGSEVSRLIATRAATRQLRKHRASG